MGHTVICGLRLDVILNVRGKMVLWKSLIECLPLITGDAITKWYPPTPLTLSRKYALAKNPFLLIKLLRGALNIMQNSAISLNIKKQAKPRNPQCLSGVRGCYSLMRYEIISIIVFS